MNKFGSTVVTVNSIMLRNLLAAAATLAALSAPVRADSVQIRSSAADFSIIGTPTGPGTLSVGFFPDVILPPNTGPLFNDQAFYDLVASIPDSIPQGPNAIDVAGANTPGAHPCGGPCTFSISFGIPAGSDTLTVISGLRVFTEQSFPPAQVIGDSAIAGDPAYTLELTVPGATLEPTPVPAALPLLATGIAGLSLFGWRRKRKARANLLVAA